jgi:putative nucleotidyltransferase with HDIG domain
MSVTKSGDRDNRDRDKGRGGVLSFGAGRPSAGPSRGAAIALLSSALFVFLFYLWGQELLPRSARHLGGIFPFAGAVALMMAVSLFLIEWFRFAGREVRKVKLAARDFLFLSVMTFALLFLSKVVMDVIPQATSWRGAVPDRIFLYLIPVTAFSMVVRVLLNSEVAILFTVAASVLAAAAASGRWPSLLFLLLAGTAGAARSGRISDRYRMLMAGAMTAPVCALGAATLELAFHGTSGVWRAGLLGALNGLFAAPIALAVMPVAEVVFGYSSDIRLVEMASTEHPLLRRLMTEAPGTFHHSVVVSTLAEAGAIAIGANPLLCRVAALFHDVGKVQKPEYFSENQRQDAPNVHDDLQPGMSRVVIQSHVREGVRLAGEHRLGERVTEIISQHHGNSLLYCFLDKAAPLIRDRRASEETFRYPGPRPKTREAALIMLADGAEAAANSLNSAGPADIEHVVTRIVNRAYLDGQLNECDMTLKDLHAVSQAFVRVLSAVSHKRVDYPDTGKGPLSLAP